MLPDDVHAAARSPGSPEGGVTRSCTRIAGWRGETDSSLVLATIVEETEGILSYQVIRAAGASSRTRRRGPGYDRTRSAMTSSAVSGIPVLLESRSVVVELTGKGRSATHRAANCASLRER